MARRPLAFLLVIGALLALAVPLWAQGRLTFQIATGSTAGTYFPIGQMLASIISHPPGVGRCEEEGRCGPPGLLASARASEGSIANARAVNEGRVASGLVQADVAADALFGRGVFAEEGALSELRMITILYPEFVHLVVASGSDIAGLPDLRRKRLAIDAPGSGSNAFARKLLAAAKLSEKNLTLSFEPSDRAAQLLREGALDAFIVIGGPPLPAVGDLLASGAGRLLPLEGEAVEGLLARDPVIRRARLPAGLYGESPETSTLAIGALWVVSAEMSPDVVHAITRALWHPANRRLLDSGHPMGRLIRPETAALYLPIPLHEGALRFYRERAAERLERRSER